MDFERATLEAFFYDYPLWKVIEILSCEPSTLGDALEPLPGLMRWRNPAFDLGEYRQWTDQLRRQWESRISSNTGLLLPFFLLLEYGEQMLNIAEMKVKDNMLLRWHELTAHISEDLVLCAVLAKQESDSPIDSTPSFLWDDVLGYDNVECQSILNKGLMDLHAHLDASSDAFNLGWIERMNRFNLRRGAAVENMNESDIEDIHILRCSQESTVTYWKTPNKGKSYMDWVSLAAILRFKMYEVVAKGKYPTKQDFKDLYFAINDTAEAKIMLFDLYANSDSSRIGGPTLSIDGIKKWDYTLSEEELEGVNTECPQFLLVGERWLLFSIFKCVFRNPDDKRMIDFLPIVYLYNLIKLRARREIIQTNKMSGLVNYQQYQSNYKAFVTQDTQELHRRYAIQTSILRNNHLECRVSPMAMDDVQGVNYQKPWVDRGNGNVIDLKGSVTLLGSISKSTKETKTREYMEYRADVKTAVEIFLRKSRGAIKAVGIDFCGSDRKMRPEVFGQIVRYARTQNIKNLTYHAGEDFFDIIDGIRTIDELIELLGWNKDCRIGHALALFTKVGDYYQKRHYKCFAPRQVLMDNLVWVIEKYDSMEQGLYNILCDEIQRLYRQIGYKDLYNHKAYVMSMKMRDDNINRGEIIEGGWYARCAKRQGGIQYQRRRNRQAMRYLQSYVMDENVFRNGNEMVDWKIPKELVPVVDAIQSVVKKKVVRKRISIETCPTSNLEIGHFDYYIQTPTRQLMDEGSIVFNINTDAKGILGTSIENEYALLYAAMQKANVPTLDIVAKLEAVRTSAMKMKFK